MESGLSPHGNAAPCSRVERWIQEHRDQLPLGAHSRVEVTRYKVGYLSTMYRVRAAGTRALLVTLKHYDDAVKRTEREWQVLTHLEGSWAPRAFLVDASCEFFRDPAIVTELVTERPPERWTRAKLHELAEMLAAIHQDEALRALPVDADRSTRYSLTRELEEEASVLDTFRLEELRDVLRATRDAIRERLDAWGSRLGGSELVYIHGDLPHTHFHTSPRGPLAFHWEFSRLSDPSRELARMRWNLSEHPEAASHVEKRYTDLTGYRIDGEAVEFQELLQYFYESVHVGFWLDRVGYAVSAKRVREAVRLADMTRLAIDSSERRYV